jgi:hypothetical protein
LTRPSIRVGECGFRQVTIAARLVSFKTRTQKLGDWTTFSIAGEGIDDIDTQAGKLCIDSERRFKINCEVWGRSFRSGPLLDPQSKDGVLMVEAFHPEIVHVIEFHLGEGMLSGDVKALLVNIARHQPEVKSYRQKWEFVDLIFRINVASLKVKIMNLRVMK